MATRYQRNFYKIKRQNTYFYFGCLLVPVSFQGIAMVGVWRKKELRVSRRDAIFEANLAKFVVGGSQERVTQNFVGLAGQLKPGEAQV